jgi:hypothetical protein
VITNMVEDRLSDGILAGTFKLGSTVHIDVKDGDLTLEMVESAASPEETENISGLSLPEGEIDIPATSSEAQ